METTTIDITPTWEGCVKIYCAILRDPNAGPQAKDLATADLIDLAKYVDILKKGGDRGSN